MPGATTGRARSPAFGLCYLRLRSRGHVVPSIHRPQRAGPQPRRRPDGPHAAVRARDERGRLNLSWLVQLHWWAILGAGRSSSPAPTAWTGIGLPVGTLIVLLGLEVVGNVALGAWASRARVTDGAIAAVMLLDTVVLTVLLDLTGGASNPFSTLYLVNVALAAVLLPPRWSWLLMGASLAGFGSLFVHEAFSGRATTSSSPMDSAPA